MAGESGPKNFDTHEMEIYGLDPNVQADRDEWEATTPRGDIDVDPYDNSEMPLSVEVPRFQLDNRGDFVV